MSLLTRIERLEKKRGLHGGDALAFEARIARLEAGDASHLSDAELADELAELEARVRSLMTDEELRGEISALSAILASRHV